MKNGWSGFYLLLSVAFLTFESLLGACTFPTFITGNWISSEKGTLNFTSDSLYGYPLSLTVAVNSVDFDCMEQNATLYVLKSKSTVVLFGHDFDIYLCLDIHPVSRYKYWYQVGQDKEPSIGERFFAAFDGTAVTETQACTRSKPYEYVTFNTLVKEGGYEGGLIEATCPTKLLHTFSNGTLTSSDGTMSCTSVQLDVCTDRTQMRLTYDASCDASLTIASDGMSECLHYLSNDTSGVTYLHVWNNDSTLATGFKRINCYAFEKNGDTMVGTLYPGPCEPEQTTSSVPSPGIIVEHNNVTRAHSVSGTQFVELVPVPCCSAPKVFVQPESTDTSLSVCQTSEFKRIKLSPCGDLRTCQDTTEGQGQLLYYVAIAIGSVVFILLIIILICVIYRTKCRCCTRCCRKCCQKCRRNKNRVGQSDEHLSSSSTGMTTVEEGEDPYLRAIKRSGKLSPGIFVAKKAIKLGPIIEPYLEPPPKVELLYGVEPRPTSSRLMFNTSMFFSQLSLRYKE